MNLESQIFELQDNARRLLPVTVAYAELGKIHGIYFYQPGKAALIICNSQLSEKGVIGAFMGEVHLNQKPDQPRLCIRVLGHIYDDLELGFAEVKRLELIEEFRNLHPETKGLTFQKWQKLFNPWRETREREAREAVLAC